MFEFGYPGFSEFSVDVMIRTCLLRLFYFSGWERPHIHFCVEHVWTNCPGWVMWKCDKPAVQGLDVMFANLLNFISKVVHFKRDDTDVLSKSCTFGLDFSRSAN